MCNGNPLCLPPLYTYAWQRTNSILLIVFADDYEMCNTTTQTHSYTQTNTFAAKIWKPRIQMQIAKNKNCSHTISRHFDPIVPFQLARTHTSPIDSFIADILWWFVFEFFFFSMNIYFWNDVFEAFASRVFWAYPADHQFILNKGKMAILSKEKRKILVLNNNKTNVHHLSCLHSYCVNNKPIDFSYW